MVRKTSGCQRPPGRGQQVKHTGVFLGCWDYGDDAVMVTPQVEVLYHHVIRKETEVQGDEVPNLRSHSL